MEDLLRAISKYKNEGRLAMYYMNDKHHFAEVW
jgi:hypothetical protein